MTDKKQMTVQVIFGEDISLSETDRDVYAADSVCQTRFILSQEISAIFTTTAKADRIEKVIDILGYIKKDLACIEANIQEANYQEYYGIGIDYEKAKLMKRFLVRIDPYFTEGVDWGDELNKRIHYLEDFTNEDVWRLKAMIDLGTEDIQPEPREKEE